MNFNTNTSEQNEKEKEEKQGTALEEVINFSELHNLTGEEMNIAYLITFGVYPDVAPREEVYEFARIIDEQVEAGLIITRVKDFIESAFNYENAPQNLISFVNTLDITEKEKQILYSILNEKRAGGLEVRSRNTGHILSSISISDEETNHPNSLATNLYGFLKKFDKNQITISFIT